MPMQAVVLALAVVVPLLMCAVAAGQESQRSRLWGEAGEAWAPDSRLPDFSYAGFERGERPIPDLNDAPRRSVRDFGAVGDGEADDTEAFRAALAAGGEGPAVVEVPAGRYVITGFIDITRSGVVLRGAGEDQTTLYFPKTLTDIEPNWGATTGGRPTSNYSWSGGFLRIRGRDAGKPLGDVAEPARRGETAIVLDAAPDLKAGDEVVLAMIDDEAHTLAHYLYAGDPGEVGKLRDQIRPSQVFRVTGVDGPRVTLDRALRFDVRPEWKPRLHTFAPGVTHAGIEGFTLEFPATDYAGHFTELGHNGIAIDGGAAHCWVRNVRLRNAESGIFVSGRFCTIADVAFQSDRAPDDRNHRGHHGAMLVGQDCLFTRFAFETRYIHDITVSRGSIGNVISAGRGVDLCLDHHRRGPYENLFTNLDAGRGSRLWASGGGEALGKHAAARNTYWNIRAESPIPSPPSKFAPPMINLVGLTTNAPEQLETDGRWFEPIPPERLQPQDLHEAQRAKRVGERSN